MKACMEFLVFDDETFLEYIFKGENYKILAKFSKMNRKFSIKKKLYSNLAVDFESRTRTEEIYFYEVERKINIKLSRFIKKFFTFLSH